MTRKSDFWLVVEDDDNDFLLFRRACTRALNPEPLIHREKDGMTARAFLTGNANTTRLIISDLKMPGMTGLELLEWVRQQSPAPRIPFVMLSSSGAEKDVKEAQELGADDYRVKPSEFNQFVSLIREVNARQIAA